MLTGRGWWTLFACFVMILLGVATHATALIVSGLALLCWVGVEWLLFAWRVQRLRLHATVVREVFDARGPVGTLWAGRSFTVRVCLLTTSGRFPFVNVVDLIPYSLRHREGDTTLDGPFSPDDPLTLEYEIDCPQTGLARFEGVRVETSDLQGFFAAVVFLRAPLSLRILPPPAAPPRAGLPLVKRDNALLPPGVHRLHKAGSGTELLDLRDYQPGDPPRTIAWKVSARRGKLMTRDFESEVPVRCTLFLDISSAVRVPSPSSKKRGSGTASDRPLDRLIELAGAIVRGCASQRDLTGLCLFDEATTRFARPGRGSTHVSRLMSLLGDAAALSPQAPLADPEPLIPVALSLAREVYPDLLDENLNAVPGWLTWLVGHPAYPRYPRGWTGWLDRNKRSVLFAGTVLVPLATVALGLLSILFLPPGETTGWTLLALLACLPLATTAAWLVFFFALIVGGQRRTLFRARKQVAAILAVLHDLPTDALQRLLEDDDYFTLHAQRFLADHQVPFAVPLFGPTGRYLLAEPAKASVLSRAITRTAAHAIDNELYVILADLIDLDGQLAPLLQALKVARARHHQAVIICAWPRGVPLPGDRDRVSRPDSVEGMLASLLHKQFHEAFDRLQREFAHLSVPVVCAASDEPIPLVLKRMDRLRTVGGRR